MKIKDCWIQPEIDAFDPKKEQPASYVRRAFVLQKPVRRAGLRGGVAVQSLRWDSPAEAGL